MARLRLNSAMWSSDPLPKTFDTLAVFQFKFRNENRTVADRKSKGTTLVEKNGKCELLKGHSARFQRCHPTCLTSNAVDFQFCHDFGVSKASEKWILRNTFIKSNLPTIVIQVVQLMTFYIVFFFGIPRKNHPRWNFNHKRSELNESLWIKPHWNRTISIRHWMHLQVIMVRSLFWFIAFVIDTFCLSSQIAR